MAAATTIGSVGPIPVTLRMNAGGDHYVSVKSSKYLSHLQPGTHVQTTLSHVVTKESVVVTRPLNSDRDIYLGKPRKERIEPRMVPATWRNSFRFHVGGHKYGELRDEVIGLFEWGPHILPETPPEKLQQERVPRRNAGAVNKEIYRRVIVETYHGSCPCCVKRIIVQDGRFVNQAEDHWTDNRMMNALHQMWLICQPCNLAFQTRARSRLRDEAAFKEFQRRVELLTKGTD